MSTRFVPTQSSIRLIAWDHRRTPPLPPFLPFIGTSSETHYPPRHNGLFYDGHAQALRPVDLSVRNFHEPGSLPDLAAYPDE